jgi:heme oxygenase
MTAAAEAPDDVLRRLRTDTAPEHAAVERALGLLDPDLATERLGAVLTRLHGFWTAAETGLDEWAARRPLDAAAVRWADRRRAHLFRSDLHGLGLPGSPDLPALPPVADTDQALGRLYVLEGATLGGVFIDRHLAGLPHLAGVRLRAFSPYGTDTGAMWHAFRRVTRNRVAAGGDPEVVIGSARRTFGALAAWCGARPELSRDR